MLEDPIEDKKIKTIANLIKGILITRSCGEHGDFSTELVEKMPPIAFGIKFGYSDTEGACIHILDEIPLTIWPAYGRKAMEEFEGANALCITFLIENHKRNLNDEVVALVYDADKKESNIYFFSTNLEHIETTKDFLSLEFIDADYSKTSEHLYDIATFGRHILKFEQEENRPHFDKNGKIKDGIFFNDKPLEV